MNYSTKYMRYDKLYDERSNAEIQTFGDAFWYSIATLTTVGYGDLIPVTALGHVIGMIFLSIFNPLIRLPLII